MTLVEWTSIISAVSSGVFFAVGWSVWASWWLGKQFSQTRNLIWERATLLQASLESKLEYHEKHDDERFQLISNDLWDIRIRNASKDGHPITPRSN